MYFSSLAINPRNSLSALLGASIFWNILFVSYHSHFDSSNRLTTSN